MKRILDAILLTTIVLAAYVVRAETWTDPDTGYTWMYALESRNSFAFGSMVHGYYNNGNHPAITPKPYGDISIPASFSNYPVTTIGLYAFSGCNGLTSVMIPDSVTRILNEAFYGCSGLMNVTIPNGVTEIAEAFQYCSSLRMVTIPGNVTSMSGAFTGCRGLESVIIEEGVTSIGSHVFDKCSGLKSVTIPYGVTSIGKMAFAGCTNLMGLAIPSSVTSIGDYAFSGCSAFENIEIPEGVKTIGDGAFSYCNSLTSITIPNSVTRIGNACFKYCGALDGISVSENNQVYQSVFGLLLTKDGEALVHGKNGIVEIPVGVTTISDYAFSGCDDLTSIEIPNGVTNIGAYAFYGCRGLTSVVLPDSVLDIGNLAFANCNRLESITIPGRFKGNLGANVFNGCSGNLSIKYEYTWQDVVFDANGGNIDEDNRKVLKGDTAGTLPTPTREHYKFIGWYTASTGGEQITESYRFWDSMTCFARWKIDQYSVVFNANGGSGGKSVTQDYGTALTAPKVTRTGYTFTGWSPEVAETVPASNVAYTAQWKINQYNVAFDGNGGVGSVTNELDYASEIVAPEVRRTGYTFIGWSPKVDATVPASNVTYTAQWRINQYEVMFDTNGGVREPDIVAPTEGLVAHYPFDGNVSDESGNGNIGTEQGLLAVEDRNGRVGRAFDFCGNGWIKVPSSSSLNTVTNIFTMSFWMKVNSWNNNGIFIITKDYQFGCAFINGDWKTQDGGEWFLGGSGSEDDFSLGFSVPLREWHHWSVTSDGNQMVVYVDGAVKTVFEGTAKVFARTSPMYIGRTGDYFGRRICLDGVLDDLRIYNRALDNAEVATLSRTTEYTIDGMHQYGEPIFAPQIMREGYTFVGWSPLI